MSEQQDPEQLKEEIAATREELGDTIEALTHKVDPREQAKAAAHAVADKASEVGHKVQERTPQPVLDAATKARDAVTPTVNTARDKLRGHEKQAIGVAAGVVVLLLVLRRRRKNS